MQPKNAHALNNTWKRQDTTQDLIVWFSGVMPNPAHAWTVRVADSKGYLGDYDATLQGNRFVIDTGQFADFPVGHYVLEIWETYSKDGKAETGIYPNPDSFVTFDINANVVDDGLVKAFDLDEVLGKAAARANKAIVVDGTETLPAGSQAAVESHYDGERVHFTFRLPKGADGKDGKDGADGATPQIGSNGNWVIAGHDTGKTSVGRQGDKGDPPTLRVGSVTKVAPGGTPTASVTGSNGSYAINLGIPEGQQGTGFNRSGIASGTDLNSIKQSGYYSSMGATNLKNVPPVANTSYFNLVVFSDGDTLTQLVMDPNTAVMYMRGCTGGLTNWYPWAKIGGVSDQSGRNLLPGTSTKLISKSTTNNWVRFYEYTSQYLIDALQGKGPFVARVWIDKPSVDSWLQFYSRGNGLFKGNTIKAGQSGYSTLTGEIKNDSDSINIVIGGGDTASVSLSYKELKLEYGDTPTAYSHAPEDLDNLINRVGGVSDALSGAIGINHNLITATAKIRWNPTLGQISTPEDGTVRFTFTDSTVRGLWASRDVGPVKTGKKYIFRCKIRANEPMDSLVAGNSSAIWDKTTITTDWQDLEAIFDSAKGFNIYASGQSGDWFEIKDQVLIEAGGVATPNLMTFSDQTLTVNQSFPMWSGIPVTDVLSPGHYFASYRYDTSGDRTNTTRIRITTHDTKYDASAKWGGYPVVGNPAYLEFDVPDDGRSYMAWLYTTDYQVSATVPMHYTDGYIGKLSDQVGG